MLYIYIYWTARPSPLVRGVCGPPTQYQTFPFLEPQAAPVSPQTYHVHADVSPENRVTSIRSFITCTKPPWTATELVVFGDLEIVDKTMCLNFELQHEVTIISSDPWVIISEPKPWISCFAPTSQSVKIWYSGGYMPTSHTQSTSDRIWKYMNSDSVR